MIAAKFKKKKKRGGWKEVEWGGEENNKQTCITPSRLFPLLSIVKPRGPITTLAPAGMPCVMPEINPCSPGGIPGGSGTPGAGTPPGAPAPAAGPPAAAAGAAAGAGTGCAPEDVVVDDEEEEEEEVVCVVAGAAGSFCCTTSSTPWSRRFSSLTVCVSFTTRPR